MSALVSAFIAELSHEDLAELADLLRPHLTPAPSAGRWLNAAAAAEYIGATRDRIYDLVQLRKLEPRRDGRRLLFRREDLDDYLQAGNR